MRYLMSALISFLAAILCLAINQLFFSPGVLAHDEYYWSHLAIQNCTHLSCVLISISGFLIALIVNGDPILIGFGAGAILPVVAFLEAIIYRGSHNLLPFELMVYPFYFLLYGGSATVGALLGWLLRRYGLTVKRK